MTYIIKILEASEQIAASKEITGQIQAVASASDSIANGSQQVVLSMDKVDA